MKQLLAVAALVVGMSSAHADDYQRFGAWSTVAAPEGCILAAKVQAEDGSPAKLQIITADRNGGLSARLDTEDGKALPTGSLQIKIMSGEELATAFAKNSVPDGGKGTARALMTSDEFKPVVQGLLHADKALVRVSDDGEFYAVPIVHDEVFDAVMAFGQCRVRGGFSR